MCTGPFLQQLSQCCFLQKAQFWHPRFVHARCCWLKHHISLANIQKCQGDSLSQPCTQIPTGQLKGRQFCAKPSQNTGHFWLGCIFHLKCIKKQRSSCLLNTIFFHKNVLHNTVSEHKSIYGSSVSSQWRKSCKTYAYMLKLRKIM